MKDEALPARVTRQLGRWAPVVMWMGAIYLQSSQSSLPLPGIEWLDEAIRIIGHFAEYIVLALLLSRATARDSSLRRWAVVLIVCAAYALSDEWHQSLVPGRDASAFDLLVDMAGAAVGCGVYFNRMKTAAREWRTRATPATRDRERHTSGSHTSDS